MCCRLLRRCHSLPFLSSLLPVALLLPVTEDPSEVDPQGISPQGCPWCSLLDPPGPSQCCKASINTCLHVLVSCKSRSYNCKAHSVLEQSHGDLNHQRRWHTKEPNEIRIIYWKPTLADILKLTLRSQPNDFPTNSTT